MPQPRIQKLPFFKDPQNIQDAMRRGNAASLVFQSELREVKDKRAYPWIVVWSSFSRPWFRAFWNHGLEIGRLWFVTFRLCCKRAYPWIVVWSCSCTTPQYSAKRSIRKQHQKTFLDRGKLSRFFSGTIWAPPCTLPKKTSRDNNKKLPKEANPRAPKHAFGAQNEAKMMKNRGPGAFQQQSGSEQGPEVKKDPKLSFAPPHPLFWTHFECLLGLIFRTFLEPLFSFFLQNRSPKWDQHGVPFWDVGPSSSVVNNNKISLFGALDGAPFLGPPPRPLKIRPGSIFLDFWDPKNAQMGV